MMKKRYSSVMLWIVLALSLCGCGSGDMEKTISLPKKESGEETGFTIKDIQEYAYQGHSEETVFLSWGRPDSKSVYRLKMEEEGYVYQELDAQQKKVLNSTFVDDRTMMYVKIAPGGNYISYEVSEALKGKKQEGRLIVFSAETGVRKVLKKWDPEIEAYSYTWSDDGTKLFSWQIGNNSAKNSYEDWKVTRYDMTSAQIEKVEFMLKSSGYGWRSVLPNADGTEIYVREEHKDYYVINESESEAGAKKKQEQANENVIDESENTEPLSDMDAKNWILIPEKMEVRKLEEYSGEAVYPVKYTKAGLYAQDTKGNLFLVRDVKNNPMKTQLFKTENIEVYICENGDHIFLLEWINNMSCFQITGVRVENGRVKARQVLYKSDMGDEVDEVSILNDRMLVIRGYRYTEGSDSHICKITGLEFS